MACYSVYGHGVPVVRSLELSCVPCVCRELRGVILPRGRVTWARSSGYCPGVPPVQLPEPELYFVPWVCRRSLGLWNGVGVVFASRKVQSLYHGQLVLFLFVPICIGVCCGEEKSAVSEELYLVPWVRRWSLGLWNGVSVVFVSRWVQSLYHGQLFLFLFVPNCNGDCGGKEKSAVSVSRWFWSLYNGQLSLFCWCRFVTGAVVE